MKDEQNRIELELQAAESGEFEILAISAGLGNGWEFPAQVLQESVGMWDKVECYLDHHMAQRSVRNLAGVLYSPAWDAARLGIVAKLRAVGPGAQVLQALGAAMLSEGVKPKVGFSADVIFTAEERRARKILKVNSVDLVIDPARGGAFLRALNQLSEGVNEMEEVKETQLEKDAQAVKVLLDAQKQQDALTAEAEKARAVRVQMCGYLLESGLSAAKLPEPVKARIRAQFTGKAFEPADLVTAIEDGRKLVSELTGGMVVNGPGHITEMYTTEDQLQAAVDDMLGAPREPGQEKIKAARLSGIREFYLLLTGDQDFHGGYYPQRAKLATTADFTGLTKNALNKIVANRWQQLGLAGYDWWNKVSVVEHFNNLNTITGTLVGTVGTLPVVAEGADYTELVVGDSPETADFVKYGGYIPLTLELIDRDETRKLRAYPAELAAAGIRRLSGLVAAIFSGTSGTGPLMADTGRLFNATAVTTVGGHANLLTAALSGAEWETVSTAIYNQPMLVKGGTGYAGVGPKMALNPRYMLVPRTLALTAKQILYPELAREATYNYQNQQRGDVGDVVVVPEWTDTTDWAAACDPALAPAIFVGERFGIMPEIFIANDELNGAVFTNDEHRLKVRHFLAVWVNDYRPLHKSNVAGG